MRGGGGDIGRGAYVQMRPEVLSGLDGEEEDSGEADVNMGE